MERKAIFFVAHVNTIDDGVDKITFFGLDNMAPEKNGIPKGKHRLPTIDLLVLGRVNL